VTAPEPTGQDRPAIAEEIEAVVRKAVIDWNTLGTGKVYADVSAVIAERVTGHVAGLLAQAHAEERDRIGRACEQVRRECADQLLQHGSEATKDWLPVLAARWAPPSERTRAWLAASVAEGPPEPGTPDDPERLRALAAEALGRPRGACDRGRADSAVEVRRELLAEVRRRMEAEIHHAEDNEHYLQDVNGPGRHALAVKADYVRAVLDGLEAGR
jgi:hypothetical protein